MDDFRLDLAKEFGHKLISKYQYTLENKDKITWSEKYDCIVEIVSIYI